VTVLAPDVAHDYLVPVTGKRLCKYCGDVVRLKATGRKRLFCRKRACQRRAARDRQRAYRGKVVRPGASVAHSGAS
jgi:hypothetical protein